MSSNDLTWTEMKEGSKSAFLQIYRNNYRFLFSYGFSICCDREVTKDGIQSMFLEVWNQRTTITPEVQNVRSYLCTWLRRKISHTLSREKKENGLEGYSYHTARYERSYEDLLIAFQETEEQKEKLKQALKCLTRKQLEIIHLKFFDNLSYDGIAQKTNLTTRTVYNIVYEAISRLREFMMLFF